MQWFKTYTGRILISFVLGIASTSYLQIWQQQLILPLRSIIKPLYSDSADAKLDTAQGMGMFHPVRRALEARDDTLAVLSGLPLKDTAALKLILDTANILLGEARRNVYDGKNFLCFPYNFDWTIYNIKAPWLSGMAQGFAIETLLAAYRLTRDKSYFSAAKEAANTLSVPISEGGVAVYLKSGIWFEEYANIRNPSQPPPMVLNGHIHAMDGLRWLTKFAPAYEWLLEAAYAALESQLPKYDIQVWSLYDQVGTVASPKYHRVHIKQLKDAYTYSGNTIYQHYAGKFSMQLIFPFNAFIRLCRSPGEILIFLCLFNSAVVFALLVLARRIRSFYR